MADPYADMLQQHLNGTAPPSDASDPYAAMLGNLGSGQDQQQPQSTVGRRLALGARDVIEGVAGPLYDLAGAPFRWAGLPVNRLAENLTALGLPESQTPGERMTSAIAQPIASTLTGQGVGRAMMGAASPVAQAVGTALTQQPVTQAVSAGVGGAVQQATGSTLAGLAAGMAVPVIGAGISRVISPGPLAVPAERQPFVDTAQQEGIKLSPAQTTGGRVMRNTEAVLAELPGSSGKQAAENASQQAQWNAAVLRRAGIDATTATPEVLQEGRAALGAVFDDLSARNTLTADPQLAQEIGALRSQVSRYIPESRQGPITARIDDLEAALANGSMPGRAYREMYTSLGTAVKNASEADTRSYLGQLRDTLRNAMDRSISPEDQAAWQDVRAKYANLQTIAAAMNRPSEGTAAGNISPAALAQAANNAKSKAFAFGQGNLDDLSRLGQGALKQTTPNSGTAQRSMMAGILTGKSFWPGVAASVATGNPLFMLAPVAELGVPRGAAALYHSGYLNNQLATGMRLSGATEASVALQNRLFDRLGLRD